MKKLLVISALLIALPQPLWAADCNEKACIDVYTQDGKIIIEGRKGSGLPEKKAVAPAQQQWCSSNNRDRQQLQQQNVRKQLDALKSAAKIEVVPVPGESAYLVTVPPGG